MGPPDYNYTRPRGPIGAMYSSPGPAVYALPTLTGRPYHDARSTHLRYPAFSLGVKLHTHLKDISPGPKYLPDPKMLRDGPLDSPKYSLAIKLKTTEKSRSPGPATYLPGKYSGAPQPPAFTFGVKSGLGHGFMTPGPNIYKLPPMIGPTVESMKLSAPVYSLLQRNYPPDSKTKVPGPGTYKIVNPNVYMMKPPHYSMTARNEPPGDRSVRPGPGSHYPEKVVINRPQLPFPSFGIKHSQYCGTLTAAHIGDDQPLCG